MFFSSLVAYDDSKWLRLKAGKIFAIINLCEPRGVSPPCPDITNASVWAAAFKERSPFKKSRRFLYQSVIVTTPLADWCFDYHQRKITLYHESTIKINFATGDFVKSHLQFANRKMTPLEVIDYIASHDAWRAGKNTTQETAEWIMVQDPKRSLYLFFCWCSLFMFFSSLAPYDISMIYAPLSGPHITLSLRFPLGELPLPSLALKIRPNQQQSTQMQQCGGTP